MRASPSYDASSLVGLVAAVVVAYVSNNSLPIDKVPTLIETVHGAMTGIISGAAMQEDGLAERRAEERPSTAEVRKSVQHHAIVSFIDGKAYKTLKRHLTSHGLDPYSYRRRYGLPSDYPMVAPAYAERRSVIARAIRLGQTTPDVTREGTIDKAA